MKEYNVLSFVSIMLSNEPSQVETINLSVGILIQLSHLPAAYWQCQRMMENWFLIELNSLLSSENDFYSVILLPPPLLTKS